MHTAPEVKKKQLLMTKDLKLGMLRVVLTDPELPVQYCRGDFLVQDATLPVTVQGPGDRRDCGGGLDGDCDAGSLGVDGALRREADRVVLQRAGRRDGERS